MADRSQIEGLVKRIFALLHDYAKERCDAGESSGQVTAEICAGSLETGLSLAATIGIPPDELLEIYLSILLAEPAPAPKPKLAPKPKPDGSLN